MEAGVRFPGHLLINKEVLLLLRVRKADGLDTAMRSRSFKPAEGYEARRSASSLIDARTSERRASAESYGHGKKRKKKLLYVRDFFFKIGRKIRGSSPVS